MKIEKTYSFRDHPYRIFADNAVIGGGTVGEEMPHPSWYSFLDESNVRDSKWGVGPGDMILDVGAAFGSYTMTGLAVGAERAFAWSPQGLPGDLTEAEYLKKSLELNGWADKVTIFPFGVYDKVGFLDTRTQEFSEKELTQEAPTVFNSEIIPVVTLDSMYDQLAIGKYRKQPGGKARTWMKLDVEGAEVKVLQNGERLIKYLRPNINVENHLFKDQDLATDVRALLTGWGYIEIATTPHHKVSHSLYVPG